jgi:hypothetical protein
MNNDVIHFPGLLTKKAETDTTPNLVQGKGSIVFLAAREDSSDNESD